MSGKSPASTIRNITLALPQPVLQKVKRIALERQTSVSGLLAGLLRELVEREDAYARARDRAISDLRKPANLGTRGRVTWTRDELHER